MVQAWDIRSPPSHMVYIDIVPNDNQFLNNK